MSFRSHLAAAAAIFLAACQSVHTQDTNSLGQPVTLSLIPGVTPTPSPSPTPGPTPVSLSHSWTTVSGVGKTIAMTFDDGPSAKLTPMLLDTLKQRGIHATFFVVGQNAAEYPDILKRIVAEGHEIGNHSWSHPQLTHLGMAGVDSQITKTNAAIKAAIGHDPVLMRPPYGATTAALNKHFAQTYGMKIILWSVDPLDWKVRNSAHVEKEILSQIGPGGIVLSHDIHATTVAAMPETLDALIARGYKFATVSELIAMQGSEVAPSAVKPAPSASPASEASATVIVPATSAPAPSAAPSGTPAFKVDRYDAPPTPNP